MHSDILLKSAGQTIVLDTKWKRPGGFGPSSDDLRQLYVYLKYYGAEKAALLYPGTEKTITGWYEEDIDNAEPWGSLLFLPVGTHVKSWQNEIAGKVGEWAGFHNASSVSASSKPAPIPTQIS